MLKLKLVFICLFSSGFFIYLPFNYIPYDLNIDYLCYFDNSNNIIYVKPCEKGQYCLKFQKNNDTIGTCQNITKDLVSGLNEDCDENSLCDKGLICDSNKCNFNNDKSVYEVVDSADKTIYYYCQEGKIPILSGSNYECLSPNNDQKGKCYDLNSGKKIFPEYTKVCGKIELSDSKDINNIFTSDIGELNVNEIVKDERACKSGYALYLSSDNQNKMLKQCVNFIESKKLGNGCVIKYSLEDGKEKIYNSNDISQSYQNDTLFTECEFLETKIQFFKNYLKEMTNERKVACKNDTYYNEPYTCGIDEIRKIWYFYNHPDEFIFYKNEEDVINFLLQQAYPSYGNNNNNNLENNSNEFSTFLNIKYFISLLILLSF